MLSDKGMIEFNHADIDVQVSVRAPSASCDMGRGEGRVLGVVVLNKNNSNVKIILWNHKMNKLNKI